MRYRLGGIETLHHGFSGPATPSRRERVLRPWRARAVRRDGEETLIRLGATADEIRHRWEYALDDCGPFDLFLWCEVWLDRWCRGPGARGWWEPIEQLNLRNLRFRLSMRARALGRRRRRQAA